MDYKKYEPTTIDELKYPDEKRANDYSSKQKKSQSIFQLPTITDQDFPLKSIADEIVGSTENTLAGKIYNSNSFIKSGGTQSEITYGNSLLITLTWDIDLSDLDLHIFDSEGNHCSYHDLEGIPNASLNLDNTWGFNEDDSTNNTTTTPPEIFTLTKPTKGVSYLVKVQYYSDQIDFGNPRPANTNVVVKIYGEIVNSVNSVLTYCGHDNRYLDYPGFDNDSPSGEWVDIGTYTPYP